MKIPLISSFLVFIIILLSIENVSSQHLQLPLFSQYRENQSILNPAALNIDFVRNDYNFSTGVSYRNQWGQAKLQLDNGEMDHFGPVTKTGRVEYIFPDSRFFVGAHVISDVAAALSFTGAYLRAGYFILDPSESLIGLAGSIGMGYNVYKSDLIQERRINARVQYTDLSFEDFKIDFLDVTVGVFGWGEILSGALEGDIIYAGLSVPQYRGLPLESVNALREEDKQGASQYLQINFVAGIYKFVAEETFIEGAINFTHLLKSKAPKIITPNVRWHYKDIAWFGAGARIPINKKENADGEDFSSIIEGIRDLPYYSATSILIDIGFNLGKNVSYSFENKNLKLGFGYEISVGKFLKPLGNTVEVNLTYTVDTGGGRR